MSVTVPADGAVVTSAFLTSASEQLVWTCTSSTRPTGVEGRVIAETDTDLMYVYSGSAWVPFSGWGAWTAYTPTISASTTPPTGWTVSGAYIQVGKTVTGRALFTYGAGTAAVGTLRFGLPVTAAASMANNPVGQVLCNDSGGAYFRTLYLTATTYGEGFTEAAVAVTGAVPFTPAAADFYRITFTYEAA